MEPDSLVDPLFLTPPPLPNASLNAVAATESENGAVPPQIVSELSTLCVRAIEARYGVAPDGTQDTLGLLDQYVTEMRAEVAEQTGLLPLLQASVGTYLGEVLRNTFGGYWFVEGDHSEWRLDFSAVYLTCNPLGMAREGLLGETVEGWHAHVEMEEAYRDEIAHRLDILGEVKESDYVLPSMRFEVIHLIVDTVHARMREEKDGASLHFSASDYRR